MHLDGKFYKWLSGKQKNVLWRAVEKGRITVVKLNTLAHLCCTPVDLKRMISQEVFPAAINKIKSYRRKKKC